MKRKQPSGLTLKMSTTNADAPYKEFIVSDYEDYLCTGPKNQGKTCPILSGMIVKTANNKVLSWEEVNNSAIKYEYKCEWFQDGECSNPLSTGTTECPSGKLIENKGTTPNPNCEFPP